MRQRTGMRGVYLVAAELAGRGFVVSVTSRNAPGADLLVTDAACRRAYSVQVKTNGKPASFWLVGEKAKRLKSPTLLYVLVNLRDRNGAHEYFVMPSEVVAAKTRVDQPGRCSFPKSGAKEYRDASGRFDTRRRAASG